MNFRNQFRNIDKYSSFCIESRRLENLVFSSLVRTHGADNINFFRNERGQEVDFIVKNGNSFTCIQVTWELDDENVKREVRSLLRLKKYREKGLNAGDLYVIIVYFDARKNKEEYDGIKIVNVFDFLTRGV